MSRTCGTVRSRYRSASNAGLGDHGIRRSLGLRARWRHRDVGDFECGAKFLAIVEWLRCQHHFAMRAQGYVRRLSQEPHDPLRAVGFS